MKLLEINVKCKACGKDLILDKEHHRIVRENMKAGGLSFNVVMEPQLYDAFDCDICGCQTVIGERKREVVNLIVNESGTKEDMAEDEDPKDGANSSPEDGKDLGPDCEGNCNPCNGCVYDDYDREDILKKIAEAGEE